MWRYQDVKYTLGNAGGGLGCFKWIKVKTSQMLNIIFEFYPERILYDCTPELILYCSGRIQMGLQSLDSLDLE